MKKNKEETKRKNISINEVRKMLKVEPAFNRRGEAERFYEFQPYFYDKTAMWWIWREDHYEKSDETDILNCVAEHIAFWNTIDSRQRGEILAALKQIGRKHIPREPKETWVQFGNTIYDFTSDGTIKASPDYFLTIRFPYSPSDSEDIPVIDSLLKSWVDEPRELLEIIAYSCCPTQFLQRIFALTGAGSNGKSTFTELLVKFLGKENCVSDSLSHLVTNHFAMCQLYKKSVCLCGEVGWDDLKKTDTLKRLSGGDLISFEFKGKNIFSEFSPTKLIISTNSLPESPDKTKGFYRRFRITDFPNEFKEVKEVLSQIPEQEYNNLARKIIKICKSLYLSKVLTNEGNFEDRQKRYEEKSNPIDTFLNDHYIEDVGEYTELKKFTSEFNEYLKKKNLRQLDARAVSSQLRSRGWQLGSHKIKINEDNPTDYKITSVYAVKNLKRNSEDSKNSVSAIGALRGAVDLDSAILTIPAIQNSSNSSVNTLNQPFLEENDENNSTQSDDFTPENDEDYER